MVKKGMWLFVILISLLSMKSKNMANGEELIQEIHKTYKGKWFKSVAFEQNTLFYGNEKLLKEQVWYETYQFPGKLAIKFDSISGGTGYLFANDSLQIFKNNTLVSKQRSIHDLVVLSMDLYSQDVSKSLKQLTSLGYDLSKMHLTTWNGKETYVVGALAGDSLSKQFWIEKERLIFVRKLEVVNRVLNDVIFEDYIPFNDSYIAQKVIFKKAGKIALKESYFNIREANTVDFNQVNESGFKSLRWELKKVN
jgi:hypothetical protein